MSAQSPETILKRLDWTVIRRLDGLLQGDYRTLFHGFGLDLADLREYQLSDDVRYIDWNVTARMGTPYVREYTEDREVTAWFLLDLSPSVDFGTVGKSKRRLLIDFVTTLARLLTRHGNRVGAVFFTGRIEKVIPPMGGKAQVLRLINDLLRQPELRSSPMTDLVPLFEAALRLIKRRSLVFIISDFISAPGWAKPLGNLSRRHEVLGVKLYDPRELELPDIGTVIMEDAETGEQLYVDTSDGGFRRRFVEAAKRRRYELDSAFARAGVDAFGLSTEDDVVGSILRFAVMRRQQKRVRAASARSRADSAPNVAKVWS
jgi:uncharacterized protein (DUF58 family)